jgi:hypothetical protein
MAAVLDEGSFSPLLLHRRVLSGRAVYVVLGALLVLRCDCFVDVDMGKAETPKVFLLRVTVDLFPLPL